MRHMVRVGHFQEKYLNGWKIDRSYCGIVDKLDRYFGLHVMGQRSPARVV